MYYCKECLSNNPYGHEDDCIRNPDVDQMIDFELFIEGE